MLVLAEKGDLIALPGGLLLHDDGIDTIGNHCAGHDAYRLPRCNAALEWCSGKGGADDIEGCAVLIGQVASFQGITVHR